MSPPLQRGDILNAQFTTLTRHTKICLYRFQLISKQNQRTVTQRAISTNPTPTIYPNLNENMVYDPQDTTKQP